MFRSGATWCNSIEGYGMFVHGMARQVLCYSRTWACLSFLPILQKDIAFCRRWRNIGGTIWADLGVKSLVFVSQVAKIAGM